MISGQSLANRMDQMEQTRDTVIPNGIGDDETQIDQPDKA